jgi:hypothetical protein
MTDRATIAQMAGEALRELGVLLIAFTPLDYLFADRPTLMPAAIGEILAGALLLLIAGVILERVRPL